MRYVSSGILPYLVLREDSFLVVSLGVPCLGLSGISSTHLTGLVEDRSMGTLVPPGPTVAPGPMKARRGQETQGKRHGPKVSGRPRTHGEQPQRGARHVLRDDNGHRCGARQVAS